MLLQCGSDAAHAAEDARHASSWLRPETLESLTELNELGLTLLLQQATLECALHAAQSPPLLRELGAFGAKLEPPALRRRLSVPAARCRLCRWRALAARAARAGGRCGSRRRCRRVLHRAGDGGSRPPGAHLRLAPRPHAAGRSATAARDAGGVCRADRRPDAAADSRARGAPSALAPPPVARAAAGVARAPQRRQSRRTAHPRAGADARPDPARRRGACGGASPPGVRAGRRPRSVRENDGAAAAYFASWNSVDGTQPSFPSSSVTFHQIPSLSPLG